MKNWKLKFSEYMQNISRSKSFGKFVLIVLILYSTNFPKHFENEILSQCTAAFDTKFFSPFET